MFRYVSSLEALTPQLEESISNASAWVQVVPTGQVKPSNNAGALITESFSNLKASVDRLEHMLHKGEKTRDEQDMILAQHIAKIENLLSDKKVLIRENERVHDANSVLYNCMVCMDQQRTIRLDPCGHMATCASCTETIMSTGNSLCPLCRTPITRAQRTFLS